MAVRRIGSLTLRRRRKALRISRSDLKGTPELEITHRAIRPNEEGVSFGWIFGGGLAGDRAIFN